MKRILLAHLILMAALALAAPATAEDFPTKPIKFLIPFNPGGQSDVAVLLLRPGLEEYLKVNIVPQYQPGGGGAVGWAMLARAKKDGYMMAVTNLPHILVQPLVTKGVEYKTADLAPVYLYATTPGGIAVKSDDDRFKTLQDLIGYAKQNPQKLSIGGTGKFTGNHLGYLQFNQDAGIDTTYVSFNGAAPQTAAILGGHVDAIYGGTFIFSNNPDKLRVLALATEERLDGFPGVPTFKELGIDLIQGIDRGVTVPAGTPRNIIDKLADALKFAAAKPEFKDGMRKAGFELLNLGPDEFATFIKNKTEQYIKVLKKAGLLQ
ncbi:MAG: tripartite tricarboxylate transporter substrate binding protein [Desulfobacterales bacterium]